MRSALHSSSLFLALCLVAHGALAGNAAPKSPASAPALGGATPPHVRAQGPWVRAPSKPGGTAVVMRYVVPGSVQPGQIATIRLQFSRVTDPAGANVRVYAADTGVQVAAMAPIQVAAGTTSTVDVDVTAVSDGLQVVAVAVQEGGRSSVFAVPIKVGSGQLIHRKEGAVQTTPSGEKIISMPASK